jgi:hypothetical protein
MRQKIYDGIEQMAQTRMRNFACLQSGAPIEFGKRIDCRTKGFDGLGFVPAGWYSVWDGDPLRWSAAQAEVTFSVPEPIALSCCLTATTFQAQRIEIRLNGQIVGRLHSGGGPAVPLNIELPASLLQKNNVLTFDLPDARSPLSVGQGDDARVLGMGLAWVEFVPAR